MNEQQVRDLVARWAAQVARRQDASRNCAHPEAALTNDGWAAGLEEAAGDLVALLDGPQAARAFREPLASGPGQSIEEVAS